jgi:uncharacterized protein (DUF1330 family)
MTETSQKKAYLVGYITIKNQEKWAEYRSKVPATLVAYNAHVVLRGTKQAVLSGEYTPTDTVVIQFPNTQAVHNWHSSDDYQAIVAIRNEAAEVILVVYEE